MTQRDALNVLCEGSPENYNKDGDGSESFNNFPRTYRKYTKYIDYVPWPTPCEVAVEISLMANCEHLAQRAWGSQSLTGPSEPSSSSAAFEKRQKRNSGCGGSGFLSL